MVDLQRLFMDGFGIFVGFLIHFAFGSVLDQLTQSLNAPIYTSNPNLLPSIILVNLIPAILWIFFITDAIMTIRKDL